MSEGEIGLVTRDETDLWGSFAVRIESFLDEINFFRLRFMKFVYPDFFSAPQKQKLWMRSRDFFHESDLPDFKSEKWGGVQTPRGINPPLPIFKEAIGSLLSIDFLKIREEAR